MQVIAGLGREDGGPPEACLRLCRELAKLGHDVSIYTSDADVQTSSKVARKYYQEDQGVEIRRFPLQFLCAGYAISFPMAVALKKAICNYDVVHINSLYKFPSTIAARYCRLYGVPYLVRPHGTLDPYILRRHRLLKSVYEQLFEWRNLERAAAVHFTTSEEMELVRPLCLAIRGVVVPLGVDLAEYGTARPLHWRFRDNWPESQGRRLILFLGRVNFKKGLDLLVRAFAQIVQTRRDLHLIIAGPDNEGYGRQVRKWLTNEGILDKTTFTGMLVGENKLDAFHAAEMFVLPSYTENFGLAVVEAMASGLPVIVSERVNLARDIAEACAGLVIDCNATALSDAILKLLDDPVAAARMGEKGRRLVEQRFTWDRIARQMLDVYHDIIVQARNHAVQ